MANLSWERPAAHNCRYFIVSYCNDRDMAGPSWPVAHCQGLRSTLRQTPEQRLVGSHCPIVTQTVLISGVGIAGPTLAFWLKAAGFQPTLVEHAPALRRGGYVIDFWGLGYAIAERMGLADDVNRAGYHIQELRVVDAKGARISGFGTRLFFDLSGGRYVTVGRSTLSRLLLEKVSRDVETVFGDEIAEIDDRQAHVKVQFKSGAERQFDFVVGADGLHSNVRRLIFGPQDRFEKRLGYVVAAFEASGYRPRDEDVYVMYNQPGGMVGRVSLRDDKTLFLFVFAQDADASMHDLPAQKRLLRTTFGESQWECRRILEVLDDAPELYFDRVSQIRMDHWSRGRVALLGDAAYCVSLLAGQGSALAMTGAYVLAGELARAGGQPEIAFGNYEKLLRGFVEKKQQGAERFASAFAPKTRLGLFFRNQVMRAAAIPGLARFTFGRDIVDTLQLPDYRWPHLS
jgi:2-polyprenyl-6-methoxyphenol hydroxylase-like FAD-dependent oxidoreductase